MSHFRLNFRSKVSKQLTVLREVQKFVEVGSALDREFIMGRHKPIWTRETLHIFTELLIVDRSVHFGHSDLGPMSHCTIT